MLDEEKGVVARIESGKAYILLEREGGCKSCGMCSITGHGKLQVVADAIEGVNVGTRVVVAIERGNFFLVTLFTFGLPLVAIIAGIFLGQALPLALDPTTASVIYVIALLAASLVPAVIYDRRLKKTLPSPKILRAL